jgi:hypothetical protein
MPYAWRVWFHIRGKRKAAPLHEGGGFWGFGGVVLPYAWRVVVTNWNYYKGVVAYFVSTDRAKLLP